MEPEVRPASCEAEYRASFALLQALAVHENSKEYFKITEDEFVAQATAEQPRFFVLVARFAGKIVGTATYLRRFHIWNSSDIFVLDDLFIAPDARGQGIGTRLLEAIGHKAKMENAPVKWQVQAENHSAIALYKRMGADFHTSGICWWRPENIR